MEPTLRDVNSAVRTALMTAVVGAGGVAWYSMSYAPGQRLAAAEEELTTAQANVVELTEELSLRESKINEMSGRLEEQADELDRLETSLHLLKVDQRVAQLHVVDQQTVEGEIVTTVEFVETDPEGHPIGEPQRFDVPGDRVYVEYLIVKFDDRLVEEADVERGTAICLFQRVFGNRQLADEGFTLDAPGTRPTAYARGGLPSEFEQQFWNNFWDLAHDRDELQRLGVRAMQGNAPFFKVQPGETYRLQLRTSGDFTMGPVEPAKPRTDAPPEGSDDDLQP